MEFNKNISYNIFHLENLFRGKYVHRILCAWKFLDLRFAFK
jgi:hypothetical protein